jgi:hypothetical protein
LLQPPQPEAGFRAGRLPVLLDRLAAMPVFEQST